MDPEGPLDYVTSAFGQWFIGVVYSLVFSLVNFLIYYIMGNFFGLDLVWYGVISFAALLFIGRIENWVPFAWFTILIILIQIQFQYQVHILGLYVVGSMITGLWISTKSDAYDIEAPSISRGVFLKFLVALPRILFYNFSYLLFPLLFIWLGFVGTLYLFDIILLTGSLTQFGLITAIIGGMLGFLQFYIQRHEGKVQSKISSQFTNQIPWGDEFSLEEFSDFLDDIGNTDLNISEQNFNQIKNAVNRINKRFSPTLMQMSEPFRMRGKKIEHNQLNVHLSGNQEPNLILFKRLEGEISDDAREELLELYEEFFNQKQEEIVADMNRDEIKRVSWDLLEGINILEESFPTISNVRNSMGGAPDSYEEYLERTRFEILQKAISIAIGME